ncbi:hypothetical protein [Vreelandella malpeensis]|uniref:Uncharacterized protein n=1 Tax=Vreelandella malpeensis TaxID=1172368 RepID=A0ABS8DUI0_9GAMM|nr:hypothetical protein [Halomonas malpeensis]MCB8889947.1 hypothetical protein [Halomonas malpeensis]
MKLLHTSPIEITEITTDGRFGEFLFFADEAYVMTAGNHLTYSIEIDDDAVIEAGQLFYHDDAEKLAGLVTELAEKLCIDEGDAEALIDESKSIYDMDLDIEPEDMADASWDVQVFTARAAQILGFRAVEVEDEQGAAFMVSMMGRESELVKA